MHRSHTFRILVLTLALQECQFNAYRSHHGCQTGSYPITQGNMTAGAYQYLVSQLVYTITLSKKNLKQNKTAMGWSLCIFEYSNVNELSYEHYYFYNKSPQLGLFQPVCFIFAYSHWVLISSYIYRHPNYVYNNDSLLNRTEMPSCKHIKESD